MDIGNGCRLGVQVQGTGGPTVVFEASGAGYGIDGWFDLDKAVAEFATVVTYDRLGVGASEPLLSRYPTAKAHAENLAKLLDLLPVKQPVILVGWSWGGMMAQQFAVLYPQKVAGLLLMDPSIFVEDFRAKYMGGITGLLQRRAQAFDFARIKKQVAAAASDPAARAKVVKTLSAGFGPNCPKEMMEKDILLGSIGPDADPGPALAKVVASGKLSEHYLPTIIEVSRSIANHGGLPKVPTILLLSSWYGKKPNAKMVKVMEAIFGGYEMIATKLGAEVRRLRETGHHIPPEAPRECVRALQDVIARIGGGAAVSAESSNEQSSVPQC
jgi:pimeloyl-ACP methyl ester carboxylesterase